MSTNQTRNTGDPMVYATQVWLNATYGNDPRYNRISEDGYTGWGTINGLIRAMQIEMGIQNTADNFGPSSEAHFNQLYPTGIHQQADNDPETSNVYSIIQGALWCKGYSTGSEAITGHFYGGTADAIRDLREDMGLDATYAVVNLNIMKALLSMDQFRLVSGGNPQIQEIQRNLNGNYQDYVGIIPCDGIYGRSMNSALIKVLQAIEGLSPDAATGNFGNYTIANIPILNSGSTGTAVRLFRFCIICNGYSLTPTIADSWTPDLTSIVNMFQDEYALPVTGIGDLNTWMSLMLSKGNPNRSAIACDTSVILDTAKANALYMAGYRYVGRYLTGTVGTGADERPKNMTIGEIQEILAAGLRIFPIFQEGAVYIEKFTEARGLSDGEKAIAAAYSLGIPYGTTIYFAIDYDMMDGEVTSHGIPYFKGINQAFRNTNYAYQVEVYGARNVCSRIASAGCAIHSFVSDMSTGFSGNMGYRIPSNWAFDQFHEFTFSGNSTSFGLDKVAFSGRDNGFGEINSSAEDSLIIAEGKRVLSKWNIYPTSVTLEKVYGIETPILSVKWGIGKESFFDGASDTGATNFIVTNGELDTVQMDLFKSTLENLDYTLSAQFDEFGGMELLSDIAVHIGDGTISTEVGVQNAHLHLTIEIARTVSLTPEFSVTVYTYIELEYRNVPATQEEIARIKALPYLVGVLALGALAASCPYMTVSAILSSVVSFLAKLIPVLAK